MLGNRQLSCLCAAVRLCRCVAHSVSCCLQLQAICPYHNVRPASFPPMLLTCSQQDARVPFWGPLKYAARLRAATTAAPGNSSRRCSGPILLLPDAQMGHFVHERDLYATKAQQHAFLISALEGID